jgi:RNA polymerase sigma-70 factor (ECF subfamily)
MAMENVSVTLEQLVNNTGWLRRLASRLVCDPSAADDLVHDAVLVAAARAPRDGRPLKPWLVRVVTNLARMRGRSANRRAAREHAVAALAESPSRPDELVGQLELQRQLAGFVLELARPLRDVVLLHYFDGLSSVAISNRLGIADGTVRWRLKRALEELRAQLDRKLPNRAWVGPVSMLAGLRSPAVTASSPLLAISIGLVMIVGLLIGLTLDVSRAAPRPNTAPPNALLSATQPALSAAKADADRLAAQPDSGAAAWLASGTDSRRIIGRVVDSEHRPVANADVTLDCDVFFHTQRPARTTTRSDGGFEIETVPECDAHLYATRDDAAGSDVVPRNDGLRPSITIVLSRMPGVVFHVLDDDTGRPIAGAELRSGMYKLADGPNMIGIPDAEISDANGRAHLRWLGPLGSGFTSPVTIVLSARAAHHATVHLTIPLVGLPATSPEYTIRLPRGIAVRGLVVGPDGAPVSTARVSIVGVPDDEDSRILDWPTRAVDASGRFEIAVARPGTYRLAARAEPHLSTGHDPLTAFTVDSSGRSDVVLRLAPEHATIVGKVLAPDGQPIAGARVVVPNLMWPESTLSNDNGEFAFYERHGAVELVARKGHLASTFESVMAEPGAQTQVTLRLGPSGVSGVVVDNDGNAVAGADVWLNACCEHHHQIEGSRAIADALGRFTFDVPGGNFVLSVRRTADDDYLDQDDKPVRSGDHHVRLVLP